MYVSARPPVFCFLKYFRFVICVFQNRKWVRIPISESYFLYFGIVFFLYSYFGIVFFCISESYFFVFLIWNRNFLYLICIFSYFSFLLIYKEFQLMLYIILVEN